jgi:pantoate--beta-alanine ligase
MFLFKRPQDLNAFLRDYPDANLGFVPTMGALHEGHISLVRQAKAETALTVCSIFVNPTQFNDARDLASYPRPIGRDVQLLLDAGCDILFLPDMSDVYPSAQPIPIPNVQLETLDQVLEGEFRPGHFQGMMQVVNRLLQLVNPTHLYMGQKDFQQFRIVETMLDQLNSPVKLQMAPIVREPDGLAMSSRNTRLNPAQRASAALIYQGLKTAADRIRSGEQPKTVCEDTMKAWAAQPDFRPEYCRVVDGITLQPVETTRGVYRPILLAAVWVGDVRLIDNVLI